MPHPADVVERLDVMTADFFYARLIGDRAAVERKTKTFDKVVLDKTETFTANLPDAGRGNGRLVVL